MKFNGNLEIGKLWHVIQEDLEKKREKRERLQGKAEKYRIKHGGSYDSTRVVYPPNCIELMKNGQFEYIVLLLLKMNPIVSWKGFTSEPLNFPVATISRNLHRLLDAQFIYKIERGRYLISKNGRKRLKELSKEFKNKV